MLCALGSGSTSGDPGKLTCSPNIIKTAELSQSENKKEEMNASTEEGLNRSTGQNASISEVIDVDASNVLSISGGPKGNCTSKDGRSFGFEISSLAESSRKDTGKNSQPFPSISTGNVTPVSFMLFIIDYIVNLHLLYFYITFFFLPLVLACLFCLSRQVPFTDICLENLKWSIMSLDNYYVFISHEKLF
jgi:hypothetical protein